LCVHIRGNNMREDLCLGTKPERARTYLGLNTKMRDTSSLEIVFRG